MDADQKMLLSEAANTLIEDSNATALYQQMMGVHELARRGVPVGLTGHAAILNPLLDLMLTDNPAAERLMQLIERKRSESGLPSLDDKGFDRKGYMRELMAVKRERQRRLVELVNQLRSDSDKLRGPARLEFERIHAARWFDVRQEREDQLRDTLGRRLSLDERTNIIRALWLEVDSELDALEEFVRAEIRKPLHNRAPTGFQFKLKPKKGHA